MSDLVSEALRSFDDGIEVRVGMAEQPYGSNLVRVDVYTELGGWFVELELTVSGPSSGAVANAVARSIRAIPPETWYALPRSHAVVLHAKLTMSQLDALQGLSTELDASRPSHVVHERYLPGALVEGSAVRAFCGIVFTPSEVGNTAAKRDLCPICVLVLAIVRRLSQRWSA